MSPSKVWLQMTKLQMWQNYPLKCLIPVSRMAKSPPQKFESVSSMAKITPSKVWICFTPPEFRPIKGFNSAEWLFEIRPFFGFFSNFCHSSSKMKWVFMLKKKIQTLNFFFGVAVNQMEPKTLLILDGNVNTTSWYILLSSIRLRSNKSFRPRWEIFQNESAQVFIAISI